MTSKYHNEDIPAIKPVIEHFKKVDVQLLIEIMYKQTTTREHVPQDAFLEWVGEWLIKNKIEATTELDQYGNLYITKGKADLYPSCISHIDIVHDYNPNLQIINTGKLIIGIDKKTGQQHGIGADPKCGVYFCLEMLRTLEFVKVVLYKDEECGGIGSGNSDLTFFDDCCFIIQLDRRSFTNDVIAYTNGVQVMSDEFADALEPTISKYNMQFNVGTFTDVGVLVEDGVGICGTNISNGSINEHMDYECCSLDHLLNSLNFGYEVLTKLSVKRWLHKPKKKKKSYGVYNVDTYSVPAKKTGKIKDHYHKGNGWTFVEEDEQYIEDCININQCPLCNSTHLTFLNSGEVQCDSCGSDYFIPYDKALVTSELEFSEIQGYDI